MLAGELLTIQSDDRLLDSFIIIFSTFTYFQNLPLQEKRCLGL